MTVNGVSVYEMKSLGRKRRIEKKERKVIRAAKEKIKKWKVKQ